VTFTTKPAMLGNVFSLKPIADPCCTPPGCTPGSPGDYIHNPKYDCCASIGGPDGGLESCGTAPTGNGGTSSGGRGNTGGASTGGTRPTDAGPG
jgi:hypothetical protein